MGTEPNHLVEVFTGWGIDLGNSSGSTAAVFRITSEGTSCANARSQSHPCVLVSGSGWLRTVATIVSQLDAATG